MKTDAESPNAQPFADRARRMALAGEVARFTLVGIFNTAFCLSILFLLHDRLDVPPWLASAVGYGLATIVSFLLNKFWTFGKVAQSGKYQFVWFVALNVVNGILFSTLVFFLEPPLGIGPASLVSTAFTMCSSFVGQRLFVFGKRSK